MFNLKEIAEGWRNDLFPPERLKDVISKAHKERMEICRSCEYDSKNARVNGTYNGIRKDEHCLKCGCPLQKKTKCLSCECPLNKWAAILTEAEEDMIHTKAEQDEKTN